jgi:hypothetical protein
MPCVIIPGLVKSPGRNGHCCDETASLGLKSFMLGIYWAMFVIKQYTLWNWIYNVIYKLKFCGSFVIRNGIQAVKTRGFPPGSSVCRATKIFVVRHGDMFCVRVITYYLQSCYIYLCVLVPSVCCYKYGTLVARCKCVEERVSATWITVPLGLQCWDYCAAGY